MINFISLKIDGKKCIYFHLKQTWAWTIWIWAIHRVSIICWSLIDSKNPSWICLPLKWLKPELLETSIKSYMLRFLPSKFHCSDKSWKIASWNFYELLELKLSAVITLHFSANFWVIFGQFLPDSAKFSKILLYGRVSSCNW